MPPTPAISASTKRKKWTEEEECALIDKYSEMQSNGTLARLRTREKKFRPIASHVNANHHSIDSASYPFFWSWKNASTKVQNMRHQYLLVKQKLLSSSSSSDEIDWAQGLALWPNFLRYRDVFGDADLPLKASDHALSVAVADHLGSGGGADGDFGLGLGFECSDEDGGFDYEEAPPSLPLPPPPPPAAAAAAAEMISRLERRKKRRRRRREGREWGRVSVALAELREREERFEERARRVYEEEEREREARAGEEVERLRRQEEEEREWEERMVRRRVEWRKRMEGMMAEHRAEMEQIQARTIHEQQAVVNQLIGIVSHWQAGGGGGGSGIGDVAVMGGGSGAGGQHYMAQMMHGMVHVNGMVPGENRVGGDGPDDQFIVDD